MNLDWLYQVILERKATLPADSYTAQLFREGTARIAQKVGEEAAETIVAALAEPDQRLIEEIADLMYHLLVLMAARGLQLQAIQDELERRHR